jgi:hypothetical protein
MTIPDCTGCVVCIIVNRFDQSLVTSTATGWTLLGCNASIDVHKLVQPKNHAHERLPGLGFQLVGWRAVGAEAGADGFEKSGAGYEFGFGRGAGEGEAMGAAGGAGSSRSEQHFKARGPEVGVMGEDLVQPKPAHDGEGDVIDDAGLITLATRIGRPRLVPVFRRWNDEGTRRFKALPQPGDGLPIRTARGGIAALKQDEGGGGEFRASLGEPGESGFSDGMPLIAGVPESQQPDRVQKDGRHG